MNACSIDCEDSSPSESGRIKIRRRQEMRVSCDFRGMVLKSWVLYLMVLAGMLLCTPAFAQNILVYNHASPSATFPDPETGQTVTAEDGICKALDDLGHQYTLVTSLPTSLDEYDVILVTLGWNC